jgi:hypothetical protein
VGWREFIFIIFSVDTLFTLRMARQAASQMFSRLAKVLFVKIIFIYDTFHAIVLLYLFTFCVFENFLWQKIFTPPVVVFVSYFFIILFHKWKMSTSVGVSRYSFALNPRNGKISRPSAKCSSRWEWMSLNYLLKRKSCHLNLNWKFWTILECYNSKNRWYEDFLLKSRRISAEYLNILI